MKHILIAAGIVVLLGSCAKRNRSANGNEDVDPANMVTLTDQQIRNAGIETALLQETVISSLLRVNGKIDVPPQNKVSISVPLGGYLKTTRLLPGMHVNKGETLAVVEDHQYIQLQQDYLTAKARIDFLATEYERQQQLNADKASSDKVFQQVTADFKSQKVLIAALEQKLALAGINPGRINEGHIVRGVNICSPVNGFVTKVNVNTGKYVSPTDVLFELVNPTDIHLALKVFEQDINKLFTGQKLRAYTNNQPEKGYPGEILLIGKDVNPDGTTDVHCHFEDYEKALIPGTYMNADIEIKSAKSLVLPVDAVVRYQGRHYVFRQKNRYHFDMQEVVVGDSDNGLSQVKFSDGKKPVSEQYVIKGAYSLLMMLKNKQE